MTKPPTWLLEYRRDEYSQTGEDGIIEKILELLPEKDKWCVEFGAWDGQFLTNTRNLIEAKGYSAVLIESDKNKFRDLYNSYFVMENVITINQFVGFTAENNLDKILYETPIPLDFDLLSIDIDGNDYHVWKAVVKYRPKVVVIEFNPTIPTNIRFVQPADPSINQGGSLSSIVDLAKGKGYELVSVLSWNAFFVKQEYFHLFQIASNNADDLRTNLDQITYLFSGYDGKIFLRGACTLPWHGIKLNEKRFQQLPKYIREMQDNYSIVKKVAYLLYGLSKEPSEFAKKIYSLIIRLFRRLI